MTSHASTAELEPLLEALARFVGDPRRGLLHVRVSVEERPGMVELVAVHEHRPNNRAPFLVCETPHEADAPGWGARASHARAIHEVRRERAPEIPALPPPPAARDEVIGFALQLQQLLHAAPPETEGLVVVLAPTRIAAPTTWCAGLMRLVDELAAVRWIVVEAEGDATGEVVRALGEAARVVDVRAPEERKLAALERMASGVRGAGPKCVSPPTRRELVPPSAEQAKRAELGQLVLRASLASARGQGPDAVASVRAARDLARDAGWLDETLALETMLASQLVSAGAHAEAEAAFTRAIASAREHRKLDKVALAGFGLGATRTIRGEPHTALVAYAEAAVAAEQSGQPLLALEGSRLAGQAALGLRMEPQAIAFLGKAVQLAEAGGPFVAQSSAPAAALSLAKICRRRGLHARAAELDALATRFAGPEVATTSAPADSSAPSRVAEPAAAADIEPAANRIVPVAELSPLARAFAEASSRPTTPEPSEPDFDATGVLTLDELARMHWGGVIEADDTPAPPADVSRSWTRAEVECLQSAVEHALCDETSAMLSKHELAALRGESVIERIAASFDASEPSPPAAEPSMLLPRLADAPSQVLRKRDRSERPPAELADRLEVPLLGAVRPPSEPTDVIAPPPGAYATMPDGSVRPLPDSPAPASDDERAAVAAALARMVAAGDGMVVLRREDIALIRAHLLAKGAIARNGGTPADDGQGSTR